jgi:hypothetical protein
VEQTLEVLMYHLLPQQWWLEEQPEPLKKYDNISKAI